MSIGHRRLLVHIPSLRMQLHPMMPGAAGLLDMAPLRAHSVQPPKILPRPPEELHLCCDKEVETSPLLTLWEVSSRISMNVDKERGSFKSQHHLLPIPGHARPGPRPPKISARVSEAQKAAVRSSSRAGPRAGSGDAGASGRRRSSAKRRFRLP